MEDCRKCLHEEVCVWAKVCIGRPPGCEHFMDKDEHPKLKHGRWIPLEYDGYADGNPVWDLWECSECQEEHSGDEDTLTPYCPNCGAKMDSAEDNQLTKG